MGDRSCEEKMRLVRLIFLLLLFVLLSSGGLLDRLVLLGYLLPWFFRMLFLRIHHGKLVQAWCGRLYEIVIRGFNFG